MKVRVLVEGLYMGSDLRCKDYQVGELMDTKGWYAEQMIAAKTGELAPEGEPEPVKRVKPKREKPSPVKTGNPFV